MAKTGLSVCTPLWLFLVAVASWVAGPCAVAISLNHQSASELSICMCVYIQHCPVQLWFHTQNDLLSALELCCATSQTSSAPASMHWNQPSYSTCLLQQAAPLQKHMAHDCNKCTLQHALLRNSTATCSTHSQCGMVTWKVSVRLKKAHGSLIVLSTG